MTEGKTQYIPNAGIPELKEAISERIGASPSEIFITNGAMNALFCVFQVLLDPGDQVIIPDPMWTEISDNIIFAGCTPVRVPLKFENDYEYDLKDVEAAITAKTKAIFINSPHNPTGAILSTETEDGLLNLATKYNIRIVSDAAYEEIVFEGEPFSGHSSYNPKHIEIYSFSKTHAMPGLRLGYAVIKDKSLHENMNKIMRCCVNGINSVTQWAGITAMYDFLYPERMMEGYRVRRDWMVSLLREIDGLKVFKPGGAFYVWCEIEPCLYERMDVKNADELSQLLASKGIGAIPGSAFGESCHDALRFSFACDTQMVRDGCNKLVEILG